MEPKFSVNGAMPPPSKTELIVGGLRTYIYGLDEARQQGYSDIAVLYHAHGRTRTYRDSESFAWEVLNQYWSDGALKKAGLIAVAFDVRNHGERQLSEKGNQGWADGNETHAQDMISAISGTAQDIELLIEYLPTYLPEFKSFYNIMSGISLGGHTSWRIATSSVAKKGKLHALAIIVGCPNLCALLLNRLGADLAALNVPLGEIHTVPYDKLSAALTETQRQRWPRAFGELVAGLDRETDEHFPRAIPTYILNGKLDPLVPDTYTAPWVTRRRAEGYDNIEYFVQENTGHTCTQEMVGTVSQWLVRLFAA